jgi:putative two-component system response regulator
MTATSVSEGAGGGVSVRDLLDDARVAEVADLPRARALVQQARVLARSRGDEAGEAEGLYRLASISYASGVADDAFAVALEARDLARKCGATVVEVWALNLIGIVHYNAGNYSDALSCLLQALELCRTTDRREDEGNLLNTIAVIHQSLHDTDRAIVTYEAALTANKGLGRPEFDAVTLANMARIRAERNENLLAVSLGESALELAREHAANIVPGILACLADAYAAINALDRATACLDDAEVVMNERSERIADVPPSSVIAVRLARGRVLVGQGRHDDAVRVLADALDLARRASLPEAALQAHQQLGQLYKDLGRYDLALEHQEARFTLNEELFNRGTDLRIKTLQIAHDTEAARQQAEILRLRTSELEAMVRGRTHELEANQLEAFQRLAVLAEFRDTDTGEHTVRVGDLSAEIATELGEGPEWVDQLRLAGRLHDIGKVAVPDAILLKPGPLTPAEFDVMKTHTTIGAEILSGSSSPLIHLAAEVALNHHERWDGTGYPNALAGEEIPISGRIVTVADVYDALISKRTYKHAWSSIDAVQYIVGARGSQFEPRIVDAFVRVMLRRDPSLATLLEPSAPA